jgi:pyruvate/2-oxoglutarate dehydrogenase complex dihydrolipoamide dehydrogenase (E3) component
VSARALWDGTVTGPIKIDMTRVRQRKQEMVDREIAFHLNAYKTTGAELIMGSGRFVARLPASD